MERLPIIHHKDELRTQTSRIILRYPLSPSSVASSVRQFGNARNEKLYLYEKRPRNVRAILPPKEPNYLPYQSSQTGVSIAKIGPMLMAFEMNNETIL